MAFYELRQYEIRPGKMESWIRLFDQEILPFQISKGVVFGGSYRHETDDTVFFWMRRFEDEAHREKLYKAVYEDPDWKARISPRVGEHINRESVKVTRIVPTAASVLQ